MCRDIASISPLLFWLSLVVSVVSTLLWPLSVYVLTRMYAAADILPGRGEAVAAFAFFVALYVGVQVFDRILGGITGTIAEILVVQKAGYCFSVRLSEHSSALGLLAYEDPALLDTLQRAREAEKNGSLLQTFNSAMNFFNLCLYSLSVTGILTSFSYWLLPIALCAAAPAFINKMLRGTDMINLRKRQGKKLRGLDYLWKLMTDRQTVKELQVMGFGPYISEMWRAKRKDVAEEEYRIRRKDAAVSVACDAITGVGFCCGIVFSALLVLRGRISAAQFAACVNGFDNIVFGTEYLLKSLGDFYEHVGCAANYYAFLDIPPENASGEAYAGLRDGIRFENVSFSYPGGGREAVHGVSFDIRPGEKVAVLGVNGSGKTTLTKLLCGMYLPQSGRVSYNGVPVQDIGKDSLYSTLSLVPQSFTRYSLSLRENVALSSPDGLDDDGRLLEALSAAGLSQSGSERLDTPMGREFGGEDLSIGQWQKLAIARGLFRNYELIVLDEPTSALDPLVEHDILSRLIASTQGKTAVIISHRVGFCRLVDKIIVMELGEIVEMGNHNELMARDGYYRRLFSRQAQWYE